MEEIRRRGRRSTRLLEKIIYWNFKEKALGCTLWRARFERGYGPVARKTKK
jgi:hypothetical protein